MLKTKPRSSARVSAVSGPEETWDKAHSLPVALPSTCHPLPYPKLLQPRGRLCFSSPSFSFLYKPAISPACSLGPLGPLGPQLLSSSCGPLKLSPFSLPPFLLFSSPASLPPSSHGHVQSGPFQMSLADLSLISTIKSFSSTTPWSSHGLVFIRF